MKRFFSYIQKNRLFTGMVLLPFLLVFVYLFLIAPDRYVSEAKVAIKQAGSGGASTGIMAIDALMSGGGSTREDAWHLREYILSRDMLSGLEDELHLREAWRGRDPIARLRPGASIEDFLAYYQKRVEVIFDEATGILTIRAQGFTPQDALQLSQALLSRAESYINETSHRIAREQLAFVNNELDHAQQQLAEAKDALLSFQNRNLILDPIDQAKAMSGVIMQLEGEKTRVEAELKGLESYLAESAPQIVATRARLSAIDRQIGEERRRLSGTSTARLNNKAADYAFLELQATAALDKYKAALSASEKMRLEATKKLKHLVPIVTPYAQEEAEYPQRLYLLVSIFFGLCLAYALVRLIVATIQDHRD